VLSVLCEISASLNYSVEILLWEKSAEWVNEVEKRILKMKALDSRMLAILFRADAEMLNNFSVNFEETEKEQPRVMSAVELMNLQKRKH
jgi:hypothetical protein